MSGQPQAALALGQEISAEERAPVSRPRARIGLGKWLLPVLVTRVGEL